VYPFWESVIEPLLRASGAQRVLEIGALRGETTVKALAELGPDAELHVIDPVPEFDPAEHEQRFPGRYVFHRDLSLNVLPDAPPFDFALVDGDHNWYTVYHELQLLREGARRAGRPLPVLVLHDVGWPYGRRDLYYEPSRIPPEHRQPYDRRGIVPGRSSVVIEGGFNITLDNALEEGGPRNGVMTALDDFLAEHDEPLRRVVIPIYYGLAIVAEERVLATNPALAALLDEIESPAGTARLLELSEQIRLEGAVFEHNMNRVNGDRMRRSQDRYLALLRAALLGEHSLEQELRIEYLLGHRGSGPIDERRIMDPMHVLAKEARRLQEGRRAGARRDAKGTLAYFPYADAGTLRLEHLDRALRTVFDQALPGDLVECGTGRGGAAIYLRGFLEAREVSDRTVWVADRFRPRAPDARPLVEGGAGDVLADLTQVREAFDRFDLLDDRVRFLQGPPEETLPDADIGPIALLRLGRGDTGDAATVLDRLYPKVVPGGFVIVEDDADGAVDEYRARHGLTEPLERVAHTGIAWRKDRDVVADSAPRPADPRSYHRAPLFSPPPPDAPALSVVVVVYNMRRAAARTLHSLSRSYQRDVEKLDYEVIVVENGSAPDQLLGEELVRSFGPEFRYLDLGAAGEAAPSPTHALNRGIALARGRAVALMIDGAHVLTPGVLAEGMVALEAYPPAVVATQQWYVGPGQQPDMVDAGYDERQEDALFERIAWPDDGYRLFDVGHFIGERDWFDGMWESNCLFVPHALLEQVGGFDESFAMPGGGYANLDLFERLGASPGVQLVSILGEGSFHQVHGGTTTNDGARDDRRAKLVEYAQHYDELRGRPHHSPEKVVHYVGALGSAAARRTRSRRLTAAAFGTGRVNTGPDGVPSEPAPIPEDLRTAFIEAYWNSLAWKDTEWLGHPVAVAPTDLVAYQQLLAAVRPDWIVATGTHGGGRALFLASICDLLDHGHVIAVSDDRQPRPEHERVTYVQAAPFEEPAFTQVRAITGEDPRAVVLLGSTSGTLRLVQEFHGYAPLVPVGSYVVFENTILNGRPVWPGYGPGPGEAVQRILSLNHDFIQDTSWDRHGLTFNPGGFLRRVR
jgi:cephalosporin hydroxylase